MEIVRNATAGSFESNDIYVIVTPNKEIKIDIESPVISQFGYRIREVIEETLRELHVDNVYIKVQDKGALDFTIRARIETALKRAAK